MDRLSFVFSLLSVVSVTTFTFGSVIKAKNPNGESLEKPLSDPDLFPNMGKELEAFLKRPDHQSNLDKKTDAQAKLLGQISSKDQESEMPKRVEPGSLIPGTITLASLGERLKSLSSKGYTVATGIENQSGYQWKGVSSYVYINRAQQIQLPYEVLNGDSMMFVLPDQQETVGGVVVYYIEDIDLSLAMMFAVSADKKTNHWNVKMYKGDQGASSEMVRKMFLCSNVADDQWHEGSLEFVKYSVFMSTTAKATLKIQIFKS